MTSHHTRFLLGAVLLAACGSVVPATIETVDGRQIEIATDGSGGAATVVFEAGLGDDWTSWDNVASQVAQHTRIFAYSRPGYGRSTRPAAMDQPAEAGKPVETTAQAEADYAAVADWVLKRRHLAKLDVMGWSWGTTIAGGFAADQPDKVNRLVLYASVWLSHQQAPTGADASSI